MASMASPASVDADRAMRAINERSTVPGDLRYGERGHMATVPARTRGAGVRGLQPRFRFGKPPLGRPRRTGIGGADSGASRPGNEADRSGAPRSGPWLNRAP